jgi:hypothetical protein
MLLECCGKKKRGEIMTFPFMAVEIATGLVLRVGYQAVAGNPDVPEGNYSVTRGCKWGHCHPSTVRPLNKESEECS